VLTFAEELLLLSHDEKSGTFSRLPDLILNTALAGAVLMDLALLNRIDTDLSALVIHDRTPTGEALLDEALGVLTNLPAEATTVQALDLLRKDGAAIEKGALARLLERGILREDGGRVLWMFETRRYPLIDGKELLEVKHRIAALLSSEDIPDPRDIVIVALAQSCGLLNRVFSDAAVKAAKPRIDQIAKLDLIGREMRTSMQQLNTALVSMLPM
jgi:hypothetical protein